MFGKALDIPVFTVLMPTHRLHRIKWKTQHKSTVWIPDANPMKK